MKNASKNIKNSNSAFFSSETLGMTLMLFSAVSIILILLSDVLFGKQIGYVQFLFGAFGYFSFALLSALCFLGVILVLGKKVKGDWKKVTLVCTFLFFAVCLVHAITANNASESFKDYISLCYNRGENGIVSSTAGGALFAIPVYPVLKYLTPVWCYVAFSVVLAFVLYLAIKLHVSNAVAKATGKTKLKNKVINEYKNYPDDDFDFNAPPTAQPIGGLYYGEGKGEFVQATRKERKSERSRALNLLYPDNYKENDRKTDGTPVSYNTMQQFRTAKMGDFANSSYQRQVDKDFRENKNELRRSSYTEVPDNSISFDRRASVSERRSVERFDAERKASFDNQNDMRAGFEPRAEKPIREQNDCDFNRNIERNIDGPIREERRNTFERARRSIDFEPIKNDAIDPLENELPRAAVREDKTPAKQKWSTLPKKNLENAELENNEIQEDVKPSNVTKFNLNPEKKSIYIESDTSEAVMPEEEKHKENKITDGEQVPIQETTEYVGIPEMPIRYRYNAPPFELYNDNPKRADIFDDSVEDRCRIIEKTLENFNVPAHVENVIKGPTITRYEISIPEGVTVSKVPPRASDLAMRLEVESVRIEAPIPGKNLIGIEVPNKIKEKVGMKELLLEKDFRKSPPDALSIVLGEDVVGNPVITDLTKTPHLLVAGATGMGKSVFLNALIMSLVTKYGPDDLRLVLVDPKQVEFTIFEKLPHLLVDSIITEASLCIGILDWAIDEMELRYKIFRSCYAQKIDEYNHQINPKTQRKMPKIVIIIDELGDLFSISPQVKHDIEDRIKRLTQKARAAGIHVVVATQRPDVTVITGVIKTNLPSRVAFKVLNYQDSNTILSDGGAERLLGNGDMIFKTSNSALLRRIQGAYVSKEEIVRVLTYIKDNNACYFDGNAQKYLDAKKASTQNAGTAASYTFGDDGDSEGDSNTFNNIPIRNLIALRYVIDKKQASISMLQRCMSIGYSTAGRIIDWMENMNYISPHEGSKARKVLITMEEFENLYGEAEID